MNTDDQFSTPEKKRGLPSRVADILASLPFASSLVTVIAVACIVGTLVPQGGEVAKLLQKHPEAEGRVALLNFLGLTHVFTCWWFILLLCLLCASLMVCASLRLKLVRRSSGRMRWRAIGSTVTHISFILILLGGVVRGIWGERGSIVFQEGDTSDHFRTAGGPSELPFALRLIDFELETYPPEEAEQAECHEAQESQTREQHAALRDQIVPEWAILRRVRFRRFPRSG